MLPAALRFALVFTRFSGFVVTSPFPGASVPVHSRVALALALSVVVGWSSSVGQAPATMMATLMRAPVELAIGATIGFAFRIVIGAAEFTGSAFSQATGLGNATVYNPDAGSQDQALSRVITMLALLVAIGIGAHRVAIGYTVRSFDVIPIDAAVDIGNATGALTTTFARSCAVGVRLAAPVVFVGLVLQWALAMIARAAPSLQIFNIGFAITVCGGLFVIMGSLEPFVRGFVAYVGTLDAVIDTTLMAVRAVRD